jgi:hypothetical protein
MKKTINLKSKIQRDAILGYCDLLLADKDAGLHMVEIMPYKKPKTLEQLGGLFGVWFKWLSEQTGYSVEMLHKYYKNKYLFNIYKADPQNEIQKMYVEGCELFQQMYNAEPTEENLAKLENHKGRISLSWVTLKQMRIYMEMIDRENIEAGNSLPILTKYENIYRR